MREFKLVGDCLAEWGGSGLVIVSQNGAEAGGIPERLLLLQAHLERGSLRAGSIAWDTCPMENML